MPRSTSPSTPPHDDELLLRWWEHRNVEDRDALVKANMGLARSCARRFASRGEPLDDLEQVAMLGLVRALDRFDPTKGIPFAGFAIPTITGELRRHFRDTTWSVHVPRRAKDLHVRIPTTIEEMRLRLGRPPTPNELAEELSCTLDQVIDALDAGMAYRSASTDTEEGARAATLSLLARSESGGDARLEVEELLRILPERQRRIGWLRFYEDLSQQEIADIVGASQVHVSRLLRDALRQMRSASSADLPSVSLPE